MDTLLLLNNLKYGAQVFTELIYHLESQVAHIQTNGKITKHLFLKMKRQEHKSRIIVGKFLKVRKQLL